MQQLQKANALDKLPPLHKKIFQQHTNTMGERMCEEFLKFLNQ